MRYVPLAGRVLFAAIFLTSAPAHFQEWSIAWVAEQGIPFAEVLVPLAGFLSLTGGLLVLLGFRARFGAWLLVAFLVPVTLLMHPFWAVSDPVTRAMQQAMFFKNVSIAGGALLIAAFGPGPISLDARRPKTLDEASANERIAA